jgi:hypothetical protein
MLRKQKGFQDELAFVGSNGTEAVSITVWERREGAERYGRGGHSEPLRTLTKIIEGSPQVQTHEVTNSTFHTIATRAA